MKLQKYILTIATLLLAIGIALGAIGAHALKNILSDKDLATFDTGIRYLLVHAATLITMGFQSQVIEGKIGLKSWTLFLMLISFGIIFFCGNCMIYSISGIKLFALLIPIGGVSFIMAWLFFSFKIYKTF